MNRRAFIIAAVAAAAFAQASLAAVAVPPTPPAPAARAQMPEDLGPAEIDVSAYPPEHQQTYRDIFIPIFRMLGGTARAVNSPIIELDPAHQEAERHANPALFADPEAAQVSKDGWRKRVDEIRLRPPCCGACPVLTLESARALWHFLVYDSIVRKTGPNAAAWLRHRRELLDRFAKQPAAPDSQKKPEVQESKR